VAALIGCDRKPAEPLSPPRPQRPAAEAPGGYGPPEALRAPIPFASAAEPPSEPLGRLAQEGRSCARGLRCAGRSCCEAALVPGGNFTMGTPRSEPDLDPGEVPQHRARVSPFFLDTFEATVGRVRAFVDAYSGPPSPGAGAHPRAPGSGWDAAWDGRLPATRAELSAALRCEPEFATWTDAPRGREDLPANCLDWYVAFAFCAWDGGRLPSEAEWEAAATGVEQKRRFPWGADDLVKSRATGASCYPGCKPADQLSVGKHPEGKGRFGQLDLAGGVEEWTRDVYEPFWYRAAPRGHGACDDCVNLGRPASAPVEATVRGGALGVGRASAVRTSGRWPRGTVDRLPYVGVRCAR
jgi:formylglycine-generating enzyme